VPDQKKNSASSIIAHVTVLLVLLAGAVSPVLATNMWETHGNDYEFDDMEIFPVVWDLRSAWFSYMNFAKAYLPVNPEGYAGGKIGGVLNEPLALDFCKMSPHSASLLRIPRITDDDASHTSALAEQVFSLWRDDDGDVTVELSGYSGNCKLVVYDVTGRVVSELFDGELLDEGAVFHLRADEFQRGMYFAVLMQDEVVLRSAKILIR